jgi:hypothetical protein
MSRSLKVWAGAAVDAPVQCNLRPGGAAPAAFAAGDALAAWVYQAGVDAPIFAADLAWYDRAGTQTGYEQGQVLASWDDGRGALLVPGTRYVLYGTVAPVARPDDEAPILSIPITVRARNAQ